jgi:hypothetical protein
MYTYVNPSICLHSYVYIYFDLHACIYVDDSEKRREGEICVYMYIYARPCIYVYAQVYLYMYECIYIYICMYIHIYIYI